MLNALAAQSQYVLDLRANTPPPCPAAVYGDAEIQEDLITLARAAPVRDTFDWSGAVAPRPDEVDVESTRQIGPRSMTDAFLGMVISHLHDETRDSHARETEILYAAAGSATPIVLDATARSATVHAMAKAPQAIRNALDRIHLAKTPAWVQWSSEKNGVEGDLAGCLVGTLRKGDDCLYLARRFQMLRTERRLRQIGVPITLFWSGNAARAMAGRTGGLEMLPRLVRSSPTRINLTHMDWPPLAPAEQRASVALGAFVITALLRSCLDIGVPAVSSATRRASGTGIMARAA